MMTRSKKSPVSQEQMYLEDEDGSNFNASVASVFGNDMLLEMILTQAVFPQGITKGLTSVSNIRSFRLVNRNWCLTISDCFKKSRKPLFRLSLDRENSSVDGPYFEQNGRKLLTEFVSAMTSESRVENYIPTYILKLMPSFFRKENYTDMSDCLAKCGSGLLEMSLSFPLNSTMTFVFPSFSLPKLENLAVHFSDEKLVDNTTGLQNNAHTVYPLQSILNSTVALTELEFRHTRSHQLIPLGFEFLMVPTTVTKLFIDCPMKNSDLELITKAELPNVSHLRLYATDVPFNDGIIFGILDKFRTRLHTLNLRGSRGHIRRRNTTLLKFPVMEKLETLTITSQCWELEEGDDPVRFDQVLPKLRDLRILHHYEEMFRKWTSQSKIESVRHLCASMTNSRLQNLPNQYEEPLTFTIDIMQSLHLAFPNVIYLEITVAGPMTSGLKYLFMEMKSLQKLAITLRSSTVYTTTPHWDALLIGAPSDITHSLERNRDFWNNMELKDKTNFPSIRQLTELKSFGLVEQTFATDPVGPVMANNDKLLSDVAFNFAFLRMQNLKHLLLSSRFMPSEEMGNRWKKEKGTTILSIPKPVSVQNNVPNPRNS